MGTAVGRDTRSASGPSSTHLLGNEESEAAQPEPVESDLERRVKLISGIVAPTTLLTALLFYYGYVATTAEYGYFGISMGTLRLSTQDFLLKSVGALYVPLGLLLLLVVLSLWGHTYVGGSLRSGVHERRWRRAATLLVVLGAMVFARGLAGVIFADIARSEPIATTPLCLGFGAGAVAYGRHLLSALARTERRAGRHWAEPAALAAVLGLVVLSTFWAANSFAAAYGTGRAQQIVARIGEQPAVVLDTTERLYADYEDLQEYSLPGASDQRFHYRYLGLRLLAESGGRLFLLPEGWNAEEGAVLVVEADSNVRLQFYRGAP